MKSLSILITCSMLSLMLAACSTTQKSVKEQQKATAVKNMVDSQKFVFRAQFANPLGWRTITLNYDYNVIVTKDSVNSYLPYFGRAYVAPMNPTDPSETGIQFISKDFDYQVDHTKNSGWHITITPHNNRETRQFIFDISKAGYTTLNVNSLNRQAISFNGYITAVTPISKN